jgi:prepilin-type N-terminal cleavage/methylation domain-containing protein
MKSNTSLVKGNNMKKKAFTLIELLVVIAIIAVLMGILMPALRKVREQSRQKSCGTRIRQQVLANLMYADDNDGKLPRAQGGNWFQDLGRTTVNFMLGTGMTPDMFYCPSNQTHAKKGDRDYFWLFSNMNTPNDWDGRRFVGNLDGGFIVAGYGFLIAGSGRPNISKYPNDPIKPEWLTDNRQKMPAMRELVVDLVMSQPGAPTDKYGLTFGRCQGGLMNYNIYDTTSHLISDDVPAGGNVGFMDAHVDWRKWSYPDYPPDDTNGRPRPRVTFGPAFYW